MLEEITGVLVLGSSPHGDIDLDDEDSPPTGSPQRERWVGGYRRDPPALHLQLYRFQPLADAPQVNLRHVARRQELGNPDLIILRAPKHHGGT